MSTVIKIPNGILTLCDTDFACPICTCKHTEDDYFDKLDKSKRGYVFMKCKGCKRKLVVTSCPLKGDVIVFEKHDKKND
jgi:hypothetical protein